jgi:hypothetical protein
MTATIPGGPDTQLTFEATTPAEFRQLLGQIRESSGLSCGQIAIKTKMPRSTAYSLPNSSRPGLPSNREQVSDFVRACGLSKTQRDVVMDLWTALHNELENAKDNRAAGNPSPEDEQWWRRRRVVEVATSGDYVRAENLARWLTPPTPCSHQEDHDNKINPFLLAISENVPQRKTTVTDLLHYVLREEDRTRRALRLLLPIVAVILALVIGLVFIAVTVPGTALGVVSGMVGVLLLPLAWAVRRRARPSQKKK